MSLLSSSATAATPATSLSFPSPPASAPDASGPSFGDTLMNALSDVNSQQIHAGQMASDFAVGKTSDVHGVMIAAQQATIALQMTTQVRNKVVDAYQEIMRISM